MTRGHDDDQTTREGPRAPDEPDEGHALRRGASVGRFVVIEPLGRGGMATVYRAYDPKLRRDVALKMLRRDLVDALGESRLVTEAQAMARLSHPNVVVIYDVIAARGGVVFAMELVEGGTLADWLARGPTPARILEVFVAAGQGLARAHLAKLVHRDFKPSNVMMAAGEIPKVADFGLARMGERDPGHAANADASAQVAEGATWSGDDGPVGTPRFMPLEQLEGRAVDERADQYAYCVALWEALARRPLFEGELEALRAAKRRPPPALPPIRGVAPTIAAAIARGLAVDPADRWPDMDALLFELSQRPQRERRRRRRIAAVLGLGVLAAGGVWFARPSPRCHDELDRLAGLWAPDAAPVGSSEPLRHKADALLDAYAQRWRAQEQDACEATWLRRTQSVAQLDLRMACLWNARARFAAAVEVRARADASAAALELVAGLPQLERCADLARLEAAAGGPADPDLAAAITEVRAELARAAALRAVGHHDEAEPIARAAIERAAALADPRLRVEAGIALASVHSRQARYVEAEAEFGEALSLAQHAGDPNLALAATNALAFHLTNAVAAPERAYWLGVIATGLAESAEADPTNAAEAYSVHGAVLRGMGRYAESETAHRRALALHVAAAGTDDVRVASARTNLGLVLYDRGDYGGAIEQHTAALEIWRTAFGDEHPRVALARGNLGNALERAGRSDEAVTELRAALELLLVIVGPEHPDVAVVRNDLGIALTSAGQFGAAEREIDEALRIWTNSHGAQSRLVALGYNNLGLALEEQGRHAEAAAAFARSSALVERTMGPRHPLLPRIWANAARMAFAAGRLDEAELGYRRALELHEQVVAPDDVAAARLQLRLAEVVLARGDGSAAMALCDRAAAILAGPTLDPDDDEVRVLQRELDSLRGRAAAARGAR
jgi:tetratricopeptide (TPR) repeat protein/tRNA A-37 threonylcarbamoyl transferase component Bud32